MATSKKTRNRIAAAACVVACSGAVAENVPHTPWGAPDLNGIWDFAVATPMERPDELGERTHYTREEAAAFLADGEDRLEQATRGLDGDGFVGVELWIPSESVRPVFRSVIVSA